MTSARLTISDASDRLRALRFNSRLSGGAKTTLPKLMPTNTPHNTQRVTDLLQLGESTFLEVKLQGLHDYELFVGNLGEARLIEA